MGELRDPGDGLGPPRRENYSGGRRRPIRFFDPHSPWQRLIQKTREQRVPKVTYRNIADALGVNASTVWAWVHSEHGIPRRGFSPTKHIPLLANLLDLTENQIMEAWDRSVVLFHERPLKSPTPQTEALEDLIKTLEMIKGDRISRTFILRLAKRLLNGTKSSGGNEPGPAEGKDKKKRGENGSGEEGSKTE